MQAFNIVPVLTLLCVLCGSGCSTSKPVTTIRDLADQEGRGPLRVLTIDTLLYTLDTFSFNDTMLAGRGTVKNQAGTAFFRGELPFSRIVFIERRSGSFWKSAYMVPLAIGIGAGLATTLGKTPEFDIRRPHSSSCPFVYSFDGTRYALEAEAFATSISRALEAESFHMLPSLRPVNGRLAVRLSNEREETHLLNSVHLSAADIGEYPTAVLDIQNRLWPMPDPRAPIRARDHAERDILSEISRSDGRYWKSELAHATAGSGFRDQLEIEFDLPEGVSEATLAVRAMNTELVTLVYRSAGSLLGDAVMQFYHTMECDSSMQRSIRSRLQECGLKIEFDEGHGYREACVMPPEANVVPFTRGVRLTNLAPIGRPLRIRLSSLTDVWRFDALQMDFSPVKSLTLVSLPLINAVAQNGTRVERDISSHDTSYALILPPNHVVLSFEAAKAAKFKRPLYVVAARVYLYEWFPRDAEESLFTAPAGMTARDRISMLQALIGQKNIFLPPLYSQWKQEYACREIPVDSR